MDRRVAVVLYGTPIMELEDALESSFGAAALDRHCFKLKVFVRCSPLTVRRSLRHSCCSRFFELLLETVVCQDLSFGGPVRVQPRSLWQKLSSMKL